MSYDHPSTITTLDLIIMAAPVVLILLAAAVAGLSEWVSDAWSDHLERRARRVHNEYLRSR